MFDGILKLYPHKKVNLEIETSAKPIHSRDFSVPKIHDGDFKWELKHLIDIGVFSRVGGRTWASPIFIIPKKDGRVTNHF